MFGLAMKPVAEARGSARKAELEAKFAAQERRTEQWLKDFHAKNALIKEKHERWDRQSSVFSAITPCGKCGLTTDHPQRSANQAEPVLLKDGAVADRKGFGGVAAFRVDARVWSHKDERMFSVVRECVCGNSWGQK